MRRFAFLAPILLLACGSSSSSSAPPSPVDARPYTLHVPSSLDATTPAPLVVMLHGYGATGELEELYMGLTAASDAHGFLYAYADGTLDTTHQRFWNATDACCNFDAIPVDDVAYVDAIVADANTKHPVDMKRVYLVGHSNGAFMANRYACDRASKVAAIVSLAGAQWEDATKCAPTEPVAMLQVHGDQDTEILYQGGATSDRKGVQHPYPSAHDTVARWSTMNHCTQALAATGATYDIDLGITGNETVEEAYGGCAANGDARLWTMHGSGHIPGLGPSWGESIWAWLSAHAKP